MKTIKGRILPVICAGIFGIGGVCAIAQPSDATTNSAAEFPPGEGLRLDFRDAPLDDVLSQMSRAAGFVIYLRPGVSVNGKVNVRSEQPLAKSEAVELLKTVLSDHGYSVLQEGRTLTIINTADIHTETTIKLGNDPALIPRTAEVVTQIIPVRSLNPVELSKILAPLLPSGAIVNVDESANALLLTDTQADIHRAAEIIAALDSVSATANTLRVFPLQYADATALADVIKQLFAPAETSRNAGNAPGAGGFIRFPGGPRGSGASTAAASANPAAGQTPVSRVTAVADEHGNSVIVSAPEALLPAIAQLIAAVDIPVEDITTIQVFFLTNADAVEMASELGNLFPDDTASGDAGDARIQFGGQGGRGGQAVGARQGPVENASAPSGRMQKLGRVLAVPDPRTSSLLVTAAKSLMPEIAAVVTQLDAREGGRLTVHVIPIHYGDGPDIERILQAVYPSSNTAVASSTLTDPLSMRNTTMWNNEFSSGIGSGVVTDQPGSSAGGRGGAVP